MQLFPFSESILILIETKLYITIVCSTLDKLLFGAFTQLKFQNKRAKMALYHSPDYQTSLSQLTQEKKFNIDFQDGGHPGFPIRMILATFDLQVTLILPMKFESIALLVQEKKFKIDFQHGC